MSSCWPTMYYLVCPSFAAMGLSAIASRKPGGLPFTCSTDWNRFEHSLRMCLKRSILLLRQLRPHEFALP